MVPYPSYFYFIRCELKVHIKETVTPCAITLHPSSAGVISLAERCHRNLLTKELEVVNLSVGVG